MNEKSEDEKKREIKENNKIFTSMSTIIPSQKEIRNRLGSTLAEIFFELSNPAIKTFVGIIPPLQGPDNHLWHSPSDQGIDKNCLKPPISSSITQATTHRGVLELGEKALRVYEANLEKKIRKSLFDEIKDIHLLIEAEQRHVTNIRVKKIEDECNWKIDNLTKEYDKKLEKALDDVINRYNKILQKAVVQTRMNVTLEMMKRMRKEVEFIVTDLNADYERRCCIQRDNMIANFNDVIRKERAKMRDTLRQFQEKKIEDLEIFKAKMKNECEDNAEQIIRCERFHCENEKHEICENFEKTIASLQELLEKANHEIENIEEKSVTIISPNDDIWKSRINHILQEFQKFIQFALKSSPEQAKFFLPRESLLKFPDNNANSTECTI